MLSEINHDSKTINFSSKYTNKVEFVITLVLLSRFKIVIGDEPYNKWYDK